MELRQPCCDHEAEDYVVTMRPGLLRKAEGAESSMTAMTHTEPIWAPPIIFDKKTTDVFIADATVAALPMTLSSL